MLRSTGWLRTEVLGLPIGPLMMELIASPKMSVLNQPMMPNIPEDGLIQHKPFPNGSLRSITYGLG